jgi:hypothetical protein
MVEQTRVRLPAVELDLARHTQFVVGRRRVILEQLPSARATDDDAGVAMPRREDSGAAGVEVKRRRVPAASEGVPDEDYVEFPALEAVRGVDYDLAEVTALEFDRHCGALIAMRNTNRNARRVKRNRPSPTLLVADRWLRVEEALCQVTERKDDLAVRLDDEPMRQF